MSWVLLWIFVGYNSGGGLSADFNTKEACESAIVKLEEKSRLGKYSSAICVPKGIKENN